MADIAKPVLSALSFGLTDLRTSSGGLNLAAAANDPDTPVGSLFLQLELDRPVVTLTTTSHGGSSTTATTLLTGGFRPDGTAFSYSTLDMMTRSGTYTLVRVTIADQAGNSTSYDAGQLTAMGYQTSFAVTADQTPPLLSALSLPGRVASTGAQTGLAFMLAATDPGQASTVATATLHLDRPLAGSSDITFTGLGTPYFTGSATRSLIVDGTQAVGVYHVNGVTLTDRAGNVVDYTTADLVRSGFGTTFSLRAASNDFNGDGRSDLLWRSTGGGITTWQTAGSPGGTQFQHGVYAGTVDPSWTIAETFDVNGDGRSDILWRNTSGAFAVWTAASDGRFAGLLTDTSVDSRWSIAAAGDFNGDGKDDVIWRYSGGDLSVWSSTGRGFAANTYYSAPVDTAWKIEGAADFNGDGRADLLWRRDDGTVTTWNSTGAGFAGSGFFDATVGREWHIDGLGDWNGDGRDDIFWHSDRGEVSLWVAQGDGFNKAVFYDASVGPDWRYAAIEDLNGDGRADIVWQNQNGAVSVWLAQGTGFNQQVFYDGGTPAGWFIAGHDFPL